MFPYTPPVEVVYVDIGVDINAFVEANVGIDEPNKYKDNKL